MAMEVQDKTGDSILGGAKKLALKAFDPFGIGQKVYQAGKDIVDQGSQPRPEEEASMKGYQAEQDKYQGLLDQARDKYQNEAMNYRNALPGLQKQMGEQSAQGGRRELAQNLAQNTKGFGGRGLLYSGLKQGGEAQKTGQFYSDQTKKQADINQQTESQAKDLEDKALSAGLQAQSAKLQGAQGNYNTDLQKQLHKQQQKQAAVGAGAGLLGGMAGMFKG